MALEASSPIHHITFLRFMKYGHVGQTTDVRIIGKNVKRFAVARDLGISALPAAEVTEAMVEGVYLGLYQFTPFKTLERDKIKEIKEFVILEEKEKNIPDVKVAVKTAENICHAVCFARDLVSTPSNEMTPSDLAREAETMAGSTANMMSPYLLKR